MSMLVSIGLQLERMIKSLSPFLSDVVVQVYVLSAILLAFQK